MMTPLYWDSILILQVGLPLSIVLQAIKLNLNIICGWEQARSSLIHFACIGVSNQIKINKKGKMEWGENKRGKKKKKI